MPHEKIWDRTDTPGVGNCVQVHWGPPADSISEGHVMVIVERPDTPARMAASVEHARERGITMAKDLIERSERGELAKAVDDWLPLLQYAFGSPCELLAIQLDRAGCNRTIRALRKGRDNAYGRDE